MKQRKAELSVMNVFFCLAVIMIHILSYPLTSFSPGTFKYTFFMLPWRLLSFVVQGFIFLSGVKVFLTGKDEVRYTDYLKSRFKAILGPYVFCVTVYCIFYIFFLGYIITADYFLEGLIFGTLSAHFYYIPLLVQFDILLPLWKKLVYKYSPLIVVPTFFLVGAYFESHMVAVVGLFTKDTVPVFNDRLFTTYISFWIIGCYVGKNYDRFCEMIKKNFGFIAALFGTMFAVCVVTSFAAYNGIVMIPGMNLINYFYSTVTIIFIFAVSLKLPDGITKKIPLFDFIDKQSYDIYLWHMLVLLGSDYLVRNLGLAMQSLAFIFRVLFVYGVTFIGVKLLRYLRTKVHAAHRITDTAYQPKQMRYKVKYEKKAGR